ncbi:MAG: 50S ribosomal protein L24 [Deltaproteobacteria bacterium CG2_30_63_29]|nr:MAG: 50S ribosomal protein L24 [Deltaproteobacteria bacterium CG2_30_63_29]PIV99950.1 MAG: 50S ribosomal protein L24 [Deltaproteobacteria bacterium CG17_big_fil_post_rev_8_21_14_2_50_63_7]PJB35139.1 MAG: 50S ribosomal protein L24 [Deltaproteobacteria bacterium CG_4_9_14_3_um_filter_63_12]
MRIKKNDLVVILSGKERGTTGRVLRVLPDKNKVLIEGGNIVHRHTKANQQGSEGGIIPKEAPINASNVALYSEKTSRGVRVRARFVGTSGQLFPSHAEAAASFGDAVPSRITKVRFAPKTGEVFD